MQSVNRNESIAESFRKALRNLSGETGRNRNTSSRSSRLYGTSKLKSLILEPENQAYLKRSARKLQLLNRSVAAHLSSQELELVVHPIKFDWRLNGIWTKGPNMTRDRVKRKKKTFPFPGTLPVANRRQSSSVVWQAC